MNFNRSINMLVLTGILMLLFNQKDELGNTLVWQYEGFTIALAIAALALIGNLLTVAFANRGEAERLDPSIPELRRTAEAVTSPPPGSHFVTIDWGKSGYFTSLWKVDHSGETDLYRQPIRKLSADYHQTPPIEEAKGFADEYAVPFIYKDERYDPASAKAKSWDEMDAAERSTLYDRVEELPETSQPIN